MRIDKQMARPVLVTGATGFIGSRVVHKLLEKDMAVKALVLPYQGSADPPLLGLDRGHRGPHGKQTTGITTGFYTTGRKNRNTRLDLIDRPSL